MPTYMMIIKIVGNDTELQTLVNSTWTTLCAQFRNKINKQLRNYGEFLKLDFLKFS